MQLKVQKRLAAEIIGCSQKRVWFDETKLDDIKEAITKADIRSLINKGVIQEKPENKTSRGRIRKSKIQKSKGRQRGVGSRKGKSTARLSKKDAWMGRIRVQIEFLRSLKDKALVSKSDYSKLYMKCKGGFFRSKRHIKLYLEENDLLSKKK
jgi:large subunit ribosomal protein L19e